MTGRKASFVAHPFERNLGICSPLSETPSVILTVEAHSPEACGAGPLRARLPQLSWPALLHAVFCLIHHANTIIRGDWSHVIFSSKPSSDW